MPSTPNEALAIFLEDQRSVLVSCIGLLAASTINTTVPLPQRQNRQVPMKQPHATI